ncbi:MAG: FAD-dependent oxidoreductase [Elusimicrobiota bacterium]
MYDLIVIGAGPAGITASVYASRKRLNFMVVTRDVGGQTALTGDIENYTGFQFVSGPELIGKFRQHLERFTVEVREKERVNSLVRDGEAIKVVSDKAEYHSKTVIVATGRRPKKLGVGVEGEDEFRNKGLSYCATCDAPLFFDKDVAVVGGGNSGLDAVLQLNKIARKIYLIDIAGQFRADPVMVEKAINSEKVVILNQAMVKQIYGDKFVKGIKVEQAGEMKDLAVEGVFVEIGSLATSYFVPDVEKNKAGEVVINCKCETNIPGIFAAGDVTNVSAKQIIVACGEGCKAALAAFDYLNKLQHAGINK